MSFFFGTFCIQHHHYRDNTFTSFYDLKVSVTPISKITHDRLKQCKSLRR